MGFGIRDQAHTSAFPLNYLHEDHFFLICTTGSNTFLWGCSKDLKTHASDKKWSVVLTAQTLGPDHLGSKLSSLAY